MKTIKNIDEKPTSFDESLPPEEIARIPTYRKLFKAAVGLTTKNNPAEALDLYQMGLKLKIESPDVALEDAEFKLLEESCRQNPANWVAHYFAQVLLKLKGAE